MFKSALGLGMGLAVLFAISQPVTFAQSDPTKSATYITDADVKTVLKAAEGRPTLDQMLRIVDLKKYNLGVGIVHREPPKAGAGGRGNAMKKGGGPPPEHCTAGSGMGTSGAGVPGGISHDDETETYVIVSGGGTLVTGGTIVNGNKSAPESEVTKILNGPSCSGAIVGPDVVMRKVAVGDIVIIPFGVPHGWAEIPDHVDYLSIRPDPSHVLESGYVNPALKGK
jgi:hypothetical protein